MEQSHDIWGPWINMWRHMPWMQAESLLRYRIWLLVQSDWNSLSLPLISLGACLWSWGVSSEISKVGVGGPCLTIFSSYWSPGGPCLKYSGLQIYRVSILTVIILWVTCVGSQLGERLVNWMAYVWFQGRTQHWVSCFVGVDFQKWTNLPFYSAYGDK